MRTLLQGDWRRRAGRGRLDNAVALGYCFGGAAVLELARSGADLKGVVSVHGGLETPAGQDYKEAKGQLLVQHGSADEAVSLGQFAALVAELESAGVKHEATSYSGAPTRSAFWLGQLPRRCRCQVLAAFHRFPEGGDRLLRGRLTQAMAVPWLFMPVFAISGEGEHPHPHGPLAHLAPWARGELAAFGVDGMQCHLMGLLPGRDEPVAAVVDGKARGQASVGKWPRGEGAILGETPNRVSRLLARSLV